MGEQRLGKAVIKIGDRRIESMPGATIDPGGIVRATVVGDNEVLGYTEKPKQSKVECSFSIRRGVGTADLHVAGIDLTVTADTGQVWAIKGAWSTEPPVVDTGAGTAKLMYEGPPAEEIL